MKTTFPLLLLLFPFFGFCQRGNNEMNTEASEVEKVVKAWNGTFAGNNTAEYFKFVHDDITVFTPSCPYRIDGKTDDQEEFEYALNKGWSFVGYFQELQMKIQRFGNTAIVTYYSRATYGKGSNEKTAYLKETDVLVKENGTWKVVHVHVSATP